MYGLQVSSWKSERHHPQRLVHLQLWCRILISRALVAPRFNTNTMKHSIAYRGSVLWNARTRMPWVITPVTVSQSSSCSMVGRRSGPIFLAREWQGKWGDPASSLHASLSSWKKKKETTTRSINFIVLILWLRDRVILQSSGNLSDEPRISWSHSLKVTSESDPRSYE